MAGILVWFVILVVIFAGSIKKGKKQQDASGRQKKPEKNIRSVNTQNAYTQQNTRAQKVHHDRISGQQRKVQQNAAKNRSAVKQLQQEADLEDLSEQNQIVAAAKANTREVERDNDRDAENEHLMDAVYDAIVKGPADIMEFQRDFIAEGMDMLNFCMWEYGDR